MKVDMLKLYETFADNAWPSMLAVLGDQLKLTPESLAQLGVGFVPIVEFKKGKNYQGWWVIPERDAEARVIGLSLRSNSGKKVMYPASKHGLVYPVRPGYKVGTKDYTPGKHNWVRTMDAGVLCPICGKPDGCLLSAENPHDPKAVKCIRVKEGATKLGALDKDGGNLHIRKPEGMLSGGGPLPDSEYPIIIVEGMTDAASAMDMGFVPVGRPSNLAGLGFLRELVRGRDVIIVGENDDQFNETAGKVLTPGKDGAEAAFETLRPVAKSCRKVFPPNDVKDLRAWKDRYSLTRDDFLKYTADNGSSSGDDRTLEMSAPLHIAERWLRETQSQDGIPILRTYESMWFRWKGTRYEEVDEDAVVRGRLYDWLEGRKVKVEGKEGETKLEEFIAKRSSVGDIIDAMTRSCPLPAGNVPPCWLDGRTEPAPQALVSLENGVLDVNAYANDGGATELVPASPMFFSLHALPYNYDPLATCPLWLDFLKSIFPNDPKKIMLLQEWFGYNLIPDTSQEKMMLFIGRSRSGKGTVLEVLRALLGPDQVAATSFATLGEKYGLSPLVGKLAAILPDARIPRSADTMDALEKILKITGNDTVEVRRMAQTTLANVKLPCRITAAVNELPDLPDHSQALEPRLLVLHFTESFIGREDRTLKTRLPLEAPGILNWALEGLVRLRRNGVFTEPESTRQILQDFRQVTSPVAEWAFDCCTYPSPQGFIREDVAFECWVQWCKERGMAAGNRMKFRSRLQASFPTVQYITDVKNGEKVREFHGITLDNEARKKYLLGG